MTLVLATVLGPCQKFLEMTSLDIQQWLICTGVALSIIAASEIRKAIRRRAALRPFRPDSLWPRRRPAAGSPSGSRRRR